MLICPSCRSVNPQHHNFCQGCGRSLNHHVCNNCDGAVDFDAENCPQCQAKSGTYWWAIIEPTGCAAGPNELMIGDTDLEVNDTKDLPHPQPEISTVANSSPDNLDIEPEPNPWDLSDSVLTALVKHEPNHLLTEVEIDEFTANLWGLSKALSPSSVKTSPIGLPSAIITDKVAGSKQTLAKYG
jgi:RNA polymerase subunit RPABC4/transcription elongation factor Spt4